jgi:hypothetical protein
MAATATAVKLVILMPQVVPVETAAQLTPVVTIPTAATLLRMLGDTGDGGANDPKTMEIATLFATTLQQTPLVMAMQMVRTRQLLDGDTSIR